jgi:hypothetical protein
VTYTNVPIENTISLGPGEHWTGTITKTVAGSPGDVDNIEVTATTWDSAVTGSGSDLITNNMPAVSVSIKAPKDLVKGPGVWSWTVRVTNNGGLPDTFSLSAVGDAAWTNTNIPASVGPIAAGAYADVTLTDNMPGSAIPGDKDNITVTATSVHAPNPSASDKASLTTASAVRGVEIVITPENQPAHPSIVDYLINPSISYDPLLYTVAVTNTGIKDDLYRFEATDLIGAGLKITPAEIFVPVGETEYVALSVTIPSDAVGGTSDVVTVTVYGKMATGNGSDTINVDNFDTTIAYVPVVPGLAMEINPDELEAQTAAPGSSASWLVVIKNIGNTSNNYKLETSSTKPGWTITWNVSVDNIAIGQGLKATAIMTVTVDNSAKTSDWDNITVVASKLDNSAPPITRIVRLHALQPGPRIPVIEIAVEAKIVAIDITSINGNNNYDFGIMDEAATKSTSASEFTVRNTGNVDEKVYVHGTDAQSMPGEPVTTWTLASSPGVNEYQLDTTLVPQLTTSDQVMIPSIAEGTEVSFGLTIYSPSVITTPARMWARVVLTAVAA